jgi:hypothetical protein
MVCIKGTHSEINFWCIDCEQDYDIDTVDEWLDNCEWYKREFTKAGFGEFICLFCFIEYKREELLLMIG